MKKARGKGSGGGPFRPAESEGPGGVISLAAMTFDATGTLIHAPRLGEIYAEVFRRHGLAGEAEELHRLIPVVWKELSCAVPLGRDRFTSHEGGARGFWADFVRRVVEHLAAAKGQDPQGPPSPFAAAELFHRFASPDSWEVYPDALPTLEALADRGLKLAVISNWDERLPDLLEGLGLGRLLGAVVTSAEVGAEKPDGRLFRAALARLGVSPGEALHVGDNVRLDVEGAQAVGMGAVHLDRSGRGRGLPDLSLLVG